MNWTYGKVAGLSGNNKEHLDYVQEGNFFQIGGLSTSQEKKFVTWSCLITHNWVGYL